MSDASKHAGGSFFTGTVSRPVGLLVALATLLVVGLIAYERIPIQLLPSDFASPSLMLWAPNPGASAQENEEQVARPIEEQFRTLVGIERVRSWSEENVVYMRVDFGGDVDLDLAKAELRDRVERARPQLPSTVENVGIWSESANSLPITWFGILHPEDTERTDYLMEEVVKPRLEAVPGIGKVDVWGVLQDSVRILLDEDKVAAAQIDLGEVIRRLSSDNFAQPLGEVTDFGGRELILRTDMRFTSIEEIGAYPIGNGLKLSDVGEVRKVKSVANELSRIDGQYAYFGMATKDSQSNVVATSNALRAAIEELERDPEVAGDLNFLIFFLQGDLIESSLAQLRKTAMQGGALALLVLIVFLRRVRLTLCVALSIPVSALLAIAWEYFSGGSFNVLTMTGITLGIGMLVDNSVVVVENIARLRAEGEDAHRAAVRGARQIALAVTLATLTTVVVFLPLVFMTSNPQLRVLFGGIGIPLSMSLLASLLVGVVFLPVIAARLLGERPAFLRRLGGSASGLTALPVRGAAYGVGLVRRALHVATVGLHGLNRAVLAIATPLRFVIAVAAGFGVWFAVMRLAPRLATGADLEEFGVALSPLPVEALAGVLGAVAALAAAFALVVLPMWRRRPRVRPVAPTSYKPRATSLLDLAIDANRGLVAWTLRHRALAALLAFLGLLTIVVPASGLPFSAFGEDSAGDNVEFHVSFDTDFTLSESAGELRKYEEFLDAKKPEYGFEHWSCHFDDRAASMYIYFETRVSKERLDSVTRRLKEDLPRFPGHTVRFYDEARASERSLKVARFTLRGPDSRRLDEIGVDAAALLADVPGLSEVRSPLANAPEQIQVRIDRENAIEMGVTSENVQNTIRYVLAGWPLPRFQERGRDVPFLIEYDQEEVAGIPTLRDMNVWADGNFVPLSSFATLGYGRGARSIYREDGQTSFTITASVSDPLRNAEITSAGYAALGNLDLPRGFSLATDQSTEQRASEELNELSWALRLSIVLVFLLMGILFESVMLPFSVLFTIPFAILGAWWTMYLTGTPLDGLGFIGVIILAGVVVNNGIVLVDRIHHLRGDGVDRTQAVIDGCGQRVRPVLMTALTTVCGLLPMILSDPPRNGIDYRALATIIAGGLTASTLFTLWVVPLAYTLLDDAAVTMKVWARWVFRPFRLPAAIRAMLAR